MDQKQVVHKNGDWHETIHAYFFCDGYLLVQKRAQNKHDFPDYFDMSIAGHIQYFESADDAFKRETKEELGIAFDVLLKEYRSLCYLKDEIISETIDREIAWVYVGELDREAVEHIILCEDEVAEIYFIRISDFVQMSGHYSVTEIQLYDRSFRRLSEKMSQTDYLPHQKEYLVQIAEILN